MHEASEDGARHPWIVGTSGTLESHSAFGAFECAIWTGTGDLVNTENRVAWKRAVSSPLPPLICRPPWVRCQLEHRYVARRASATCPIPSSGVGLAVHAVVWVASTCSHKRSRLNRFFSATCG